MPLNEPESSGNILLVWDRLGHYHAARFLALEKASANAKVFIAELGAADSLYQWKNPVSHHTRYSCLSTKKVESGDLINRFLSFRKLVITNNIQTIGLSGYGRMEYLLFLLWCWLTGVHVILFAESWYGSNKWLNTMKGWFLRKTCQGFLVSGQRAENHFHKTLKIDPARIRKGYSVVDNIHFIAPPEIEREKVLLCVARFSPEKNLERLIIAFKQSDLFQNWTLKIVGGGPQKPHLQTLTDDCTNIELLDWLSYQALPFLYAQASFFILPSTFEPWGLVVNEAMASGLPIAVSKDCGCAPDLVDVRNGFTFDSHKIDSIVFVLNQIVQLKPVEFELMGKRSKEIIAHYKTEDWASQFLKLYELNNNDF